MEHSPPFGQADLTNCERELIHLAGSIQPHGVLLVLRRADLVILQASANTGPMLGVDCAALLGQPAGILGPEFEAAARQAMSSAAAGENLPLGLRTLGAGDSRRWEGSGHCPDDDLLILELEPRDAPDPAAERVDPGAGRIRELIAEAVQRFTAASAIDGLADAVVRCVRAMTGYDRVMVYKFDPDGHGKIIAEARDPRLESLLGHHYPATDIPQRARDLYLRNRVRVLVDVDYQAVPIVPRLVPGTGADLDMSMCTLRSMSPLHLQYLKNMGVTATLVVSLVREGRLWGLIAAHHYAPRTLGYAARAACDLLAEVASTRIAAIENYTHAQVAILVRRLEQRLIDATSTEGDWRLALFRNPQTLLQPLGATGAALFCEGEILTAGDVPSTPELRALVAWVDARYGDAPFACSSLSQAEPSLASMTPTASGVLAVRLSSTRPEYLMWFRKEQLLTVTWAGDPSKPMIDDDPLQLSPRRSFAAWSEIVRGTSVPWTKVEHSLARAIGAALVDIIVQIHAVRLLIADHQLARVRATVESSTEAVLVADLTGRVLTVNRAFQALTGRPAASLGTLRDVAALFDGAAVAAVLDALRAPARSWRGELSLAVDGRQQVPVLARTEVVPARDGTVLGYILLLSDLTDAKKAAAAREHLEHALRTAARALAPDESHAEALSGSDEVIGAILANASLAAMDIADGEDGRTSAALLEELESSAHRAATLYARIRRFSPRG